MSNDSRAEFEDDKSLTGEHSITSEWTLHEKETGRVAAVFYNESDLHAVASVFGEAFGLKTEIADLRAENERLKELASSIRDLLSSCDVDCLGTGEALDCAPWPIRDEVIHNITVAIE